MRVGFVGAGTMGAPMVGRLVAAGHEVTALGRSPDACTRVTELGATAVGDARDAAAGADVVVVCVFDDAQVRHVCLDSPLLSAMSPRSALVVHTTGNPATAEALADRAADRDVDVVDAPVSGGPHDIEAGRITVLAGGTARALERVTPVLESYADPVLHVGEVGAGQRVKLLNNALFAAAVALIRDAVSVGRQWGLAEESLLAALEHGSADSRALRGIGASGSVEAFSGRVGKYLAKDVAVVRDTESALNTDLGLLGEVLRRSPLFRTPP